MISANHAYDGSRQEWYREKGVFRGQSPGFPTLLCGIARSLQYSSIWTSLAVGHRVSPDPDRRRIRLTWAEKALNARVKRRHAALAQDLGRVEVSCSDRSWSADANRLSGREISSRRGRLLKVS